MHSVDFSNHSKFIFSIHHKLYANENTLCTCINMHKFIKTLNKQSENDQEFLDIHLAG